MGSNSLNTSQAIQAIFPDSWGIAWSGSSPQCTVTDFTSGSNYGVSQQTWGNVLNLNVTQTMPSSSQTNVFNLSCSNIRNPDNVTYYPSQDVQLRVVDGNGNVYFRSAPSVHNVNFSTQFQLASSLTYINWVQSSSWTSPIAITSGTYSAALSILL